jgi:hypothetical protein
LISRRTTQRYGDQAEDQNTTRLGPSWHVTNEVNNLRVMK